VKIIKFRINFFIKVIAIDVSFATGLTLHNLELENSKNRLKAEGEVELEPYWKVLYIMIMSDFRCVNDKTRF